MKDICCPKCGEIENIHTNYDWSKPDRPVEEYLCNECGTYFSPNQNNRSMDKLIESNKKFDENNLKGFKYDPNDRSEDTPDITNFFY